MIYPFLSSLCAENTRLQFGNVYIRPSRILSSDDHKKILAVIFAKQSSFFTHKNKIHRLFLSLKSVMAVG